MPYGINPVTEANPSKTPDKVSVGEDQTNLAARRQAGEFVRGQSAARTAIGVPDETGAVPYPAEKGRYHLFVAYNCPWCHRVALTRAVMGLQEAVTMDVLMPVRTENDHPEGEGKWQFKPEGLVARNGEMVRYDECTANTATPHSTIVEVYRAFGRDEKEKNERSVPMLFDKATQTIVNNESADIVKMFGTAMRPFGTNPQIELCPPALAAKIEEVNSFVYTAINNGAYKAGFSSQQKVYSAAYDAYFAALDKLEEMLAGSRFLCGDAVTEADVRLFPTIFRHDPVYHSRMKLNKAYIADYPNVWRWMCDFYALPGVAAASPIAHMRQGYFGRTGNGTVPKGPENYPGLLADREYAARRAAALRGARPIGGPSYAGAALMCAATAAATAAACLAVSAAARR